MQKPWNYGSRWVMGGAAAVLALGALAIACAAGSVEGDPLEQGEGDGDEDASVARDARAKYDAGGDPPGQDAGTGDGGGGGGDAGAGDGGGDGGTTAGCGAPNTCLGATSLGNLSGDTGAGTLTRQGTSSEWFTVRITEDDSGTFGSPLKARLTLSSPAGTNYDLYVYVPDSDTRACTTPTHTGIGSSADDVVNLDFGEQGLFANGSDDSRTVSVEVRHSSGPCDAAHKWTLTLRGNP
ncbi:MAG: hypothetical protein JNL38_23020 [Myxococcales bacterium]|jgi:hypothetical protein|nr:hypothetical protein [Myxococcales bacterium]